MLPKKRKFDLSKFDLETSSPGPSQNSNASEGRGSTETPSTPVSIAPTPGLPSASLFQIRSGGSGDATISLPIFAAKGLPASGFLTPETVMGAEKITAYDSVDADVVQSYLEFSLASLVYYAMKV